MLCAVAFHAWCFWQCEYSYWQSVPCFIPVGRIWLCQFEYTESHLIRHRLLIMGCHSKPKWTASWSADIAIAVKKCDIIRSLTWIHHTHTNERSRKLRRRFCRGYFLLSFFQVEMFWSRTTKITQVYRASYTNIRLSKDGSIGKETNGLACWSTQLFLEVILSHLFRLSYRVYVKGRGRSTHWFLEVKSSATSKSVTES